MQDIADRAGVSRMTVSRALRNHPKISRATTRRVQAIARELGYRANPLVSALMANLRYSRTTTGATHLAFLTSFPSRNGWRETPTFRKYYEGARRRAEQLGYKLDVFWLREPGMTGGAITRILVTRNIQGVLIAPTPEPRMPVDLDWSRFAAVAFGYSMNVPQHLYRVTNHQQHTAILALEKLRSRSYHRIGLCLPSSGNERVDNNWLAGYLLDQHKVPPRHRIPPHLPLKWEQAGFEQWFRKHRPDAILTISHQVRGHLLAEWTDALGLKVPRDLGIAVLDWTGETAGFAGIDQNSEMVGAAAVDLLIEQLYRNERGIPEKSKVVLIDGEWVDGDSARRKGQSTRQTRDASPEAGSA